MTRQAALRRCVPSNPADRWRLMPAVGLYGEWGSLTVLERPDGRYGFFEVFPKPGVLVQEMLDNGGHTHALLQETFETLTSAFEAAETLVRARHGAPLRWCSTTYLFRAVRDGELRYNAAVLVPLMDGQPWTVLIALVLGEDALEHHHHDTRTASSWLEAMQVAEAWRPPDEPALCACGEGK